MIYVDYFPPIWCRQSLTTGPPLTETFHDIWLSSEGISYECIMYIYVLRRSEPWCPHCILQINTLWLIEMFLYMYMHACTASSMLVWNAGKLKWDIFSTLKSCMYLGKELTPHGVRLNATKVNRYLSFFGKT